MSREKNPLKTLLVLHFGSIQKCAEDLDVSSNTVSRWIHETPENIMRHQDRMTLLGMDVEQVREVVTKMAMDHA
jgi:predicted DNA-binding protein YlxM (UPF0122 family)